jgi:hypothetical protein
MGRLGYSAENGTDIFTLMQGLPRQFLDSVETLLFRDQTIRYHKLHGKRMWYITSVRKPEFSRVPPPPPPPPYYNQSSPTYDPCWDINENL